MPHMIMASSNKVPLESALPVILKLLPLKNNMTVNETVYKCLLGFMEMNNTKALLCHCTYLITSEYHAIFMDRSKKVSSKLAFSMANAVAGEKHWSAS